MTLLRDILFRNLNKKKASSDILAIIKNKKGLSSSQLGIVGLGDGAVTVRWQCGGGAVTVR